MFQKSSRNLALHAKKTKNGITDDFSKNNHSKLKKKSKKYSP
jgi:hypothetical protein